MTGSPMEEVFHQNLEKNKLIGECEDPDTSCQHRIKGLNITYGRKWV